jgi:RHS repeat-associated protein
LGSTNAVTDQNGNLVQLLDYYAYGATRVASTTYPTNEKRQYIGQYYDAGSNLNYFQARYYDNSRGQFVNEDPVFWSAQELDDPQSFNPYSYAGDNPIVNKDPSGKVYGGFGFGGTFSSPYIVGFTWNIGFNIDAHGIDFVGGIGPGAGYKLDRVLYFSSGNLSHRAERQIVTSGGFAGIAGYDYASTLSWPLGGSPANMGKVI